MPQPLISILMPVREFTDYTIAAVNSVLSQSHSELELLIIGQDNVTAQNSGGQSADELRSVLRSELLADNRMRIIARAGKGIVSALNTGLANCNGDYIARMDADDVCHPHRLQVQLDFALANPDVGLIGACVQIFSEAHAIGNGNQNYEVWLNSLRSAHDIHDACFIESPLPHPTWFAHKSFWHQLNGYRDMHWPEDYDLVLRTRLAGIPMAKPGGVLLKWREHPRRLTHTDSRYKRQAFIQAKAWALAQAESKLGVDQSRAIWICGTGRNARYWHDALVAQGCSVRGFVELEQAKSKTQKRHLPVIGYNELDANRRDALVVGAISSPAARIALSQWCEERGMRHDKDFILGG